MTPQQFLTQVKKGEPLAAYLFLGPEPHYRGECVKALLERVLPEAEERERGLTRHELGETTLEAALDDACCFSLFAPHRVMLLSNAEQALPLTRGSRSEEEDGGGASGSAGSGAALARYLADPVPGVVLVFEAVRYDFAGDDRKKLDRVRKFYEKVPGIVEFQRLSASQARQFAQARARQAGLALGAAELDLLVEALGGDAARIASEVDKLALYAAGGRKIGAEEIGELVPEARESTIFALVTALGRNDRARSLEVLDTLIRQSEYLPLALSFLATQFRLALAAREAGLKTPGQVQAHFSGQGIAMWPSRAAQVAETAVRFTRLKLARALELIYAADKALRDARPDDRVVMEEFVLRLTG